MKTQMAAIRQPINAELTRLRGRERTAVNAGKHGEARKLADNIETLESRRNFFKAGTVPVEFANGLIINGTLLKQYVKKLPNKIYLEALADKEKLLVSRKTGSITMLDLSQYYSSLECEKGEDLLEELGITLI